MIKTAIIKINGLNDVYEFIRKASLVDGDVTVVRGKYAVDAKSILGVFSIDMSRETTIHYPADASAFDEFIQPFIVK